MIFIIHVTCNMITIESSHHGNPNIFPEVPNLRETFRKYQCDDWGGEHHRQYTMIITILLFSVFTMMACICNECFLHLKAFKISSCLRYGGSSWQFSAPWGCKALRKIRIHIWLTPGLFIITLDCSVQQTFISSHNVCSILHLEVEFSHKYLIIYHTKVQLMFTPKV